MNSPLRVLVVEDDPDLAEYAKVVLSRQPGVEIEVVSDGQVALENPRGPGADILISDIELPGISGLDLATAARDPAPVTMMLSSIGLIGLYPLGSDLAGAAFRATCSPALINLVGYGPLFCAITFDPYNKEFRGAAQVWDKTEKVGRVMA